MLRVAPVIIGILLAVFSLIDLALSPSADVRNLPKSVWLLIVLVPFVGPIAWLLAGRPHDGTGPAGASGGPPRPVAPDDDPDFLRRIERDQQARDRDKLRDGQADLERREQQLGEGHDPDDRPGNGST